VAVKDRGSHCITTQLLTMKCVVHSCQHS